ncbi:3-hydroxyacyl-CoA dehydrogenase [Limimaricola hongkongensis]|uniref:3-hydroxybutyryl-CoA dehydrogenase n=1 Tax=Limimaricola hongkongensis DSM 17492 TaxID=1122180 RepID=A0A017HAL4_9RHOB|nr:3-hydroxyacyl-CoA dehydrogenase [Limimaricola hongkongensis]EYD71416.1 3-hydroxybutyryl-CoA dehydrogenase [Limimaricola hongkongensis DSM 17492]
MPKPERIAIVGAGLIGRAWATVFARAGLDVTITDIDAASLAASRERIRATLEDLRDAGLVGDPAAVLSRIRCAGDLGEAVETASYVQECGPEDAELKSRLFAELEARTGPDTILASSTSGIVASKFNGQMQDRSRAIVAHPVNPPSLIPLVEVAPSPDTAAGIVDRTMALMEQVGQSPILVRREVEGFVLNRLQGALLNEALRLLRDGVASAADIDRTMRDGLGRRWAFMGPFETIDLNAPNGAGDYARRYGPIYRRLDEARDAQPWTAEVIDRLVDQLRSADPIDAHEARCDRRDRRLMALTAHLQHASDQD